MVMWNSVPRSSLLVLILSLAPASSSPAATKPNFGPVTKIDGGALRRGKFTSRSGSSLRRVSQRLRALNAASPKASRKEVARILSNFEKAWKDTAASAAVGLAMLAGASMGNLPALAEVAGTSPAAAQTEEINMDALKAMTKDAIDKGYDQAWIDDHLAQMEARGYDIDWVQQHLSGVVEEMKKKSEVSSDNMMFKNLQNGKAPSKLESDRIVSSIPRTNAEGLPVHQEGLEGIDNWVYPSPKMFWNAMDRKGKHPERYNPEDISGVVRIHNFVNEKAWNEILKWEAMHEDSCPKGPSLTSFKGKYDKLSAKGAMNKYVPGMMGAPFDRHDWVINRCGKTVRYVLDYYKDPSLAEDPKIRLDVRPAPDSVDNLLDWVKYSSYSKNAQNKKISFEETTRMRTANEVMNSISQTN
mmetsp:Transcript_31502/g.43855  ORF Transcript_31502/g.43855 Transcript_31502/m.43855 type:complete len:413 (-) Transcript_31502:261-1499(-)